MSRKATPQDNAVIENFFGKIKSILQHQNSFLFQKSPEKMKKLINQFPKFWNTKWILSKLNHSTHLNMLKIWNKFLVELT